MRDFTIVIPFIGRGDLLKTCLRSLKAGDNVIVVDNTGQDVAQSFCKKFGARHAPQTTNIGVAASWNIGIDDDSPLTIFCSAATVLHLSAEQWLMRYYYPYASASPGFVTPADVGFHWWGLGRTTIDCIGRFDPVLNYYCQDTDYRRRMRLEGLELYETPLEHVSVQTIAHGARILGLKGNENDIYFEQKWGCTPNEAGDITVGYATPYNQ